jgi:hypothetical protein
LPDRNAALSVRAPDVAGTRGLRVPGRSTMQEWWVIADQLVDVFGCHIYGMSVCHIYCIQASRIYGRMRALIQARTAECQR